MKLLKRSAKAVPETQTETDMNAEKRAKYGPWSAIIVTLTTFFGSQVLLGLFLGVYIALTNKDSEQVIDSLSDTTLGQFISIVIVEACALALLYIFMRSRKITASEIGLGRKPVAKDVGYAVLYFVVYFVVLAIILALVSELLPNIDLDQEQQLGFEKAKENGSLILVFISLVILPPIVEEILIRGFLYSGLRTKLSKIRAALIASLIFGVAHLQLGMGAPPLYVAAIDTFVLSLFLIHLRERTGALWSGMLVHGIKNGLAFVVLFIVGTS